MNLLGFFAIVIAVTGVIWLLQLIIKGKDRIDINISVGRSNLPRLVVPIKPPGPYKTPGSTRSDSESVLGDVITYSGQIPLPPSPISDQAAASGFGGPDQPNHDAYLDLIDEDFDEHSNASLLDATPGQWHPPMGQLTFSGFGNLVAQLPADSFEKPQSPQQIEAMFAVLRESTRRIEQQMIALYEVHRSMRENPDSTLSIQLASGSQSHTDSGDYDFGDDDDLDESSFGGGLDAQLAPIFPGEESQSAHATEFLSMEELGIPIADDVFQSYDASEALEPAPEIRKEALPYFASLNKTGELSFEVVEAIRRKSPSREVKHRVRQVLRAIDHYNLGNDANAALRVTAVFRQLPKDLGEFDNDVAAIGRLFGLVEPDIDVYEIDEHSVS